MKKNLQMRHQGATTRSSRGKGKPKSACKSPTPVIIRRPLKRLVAAAYKNGGEKRAVTVVKAFDALSKLPNHTLSALIEFEESRS